MYDTERCIYVYDWLDVNQRTEVVEASHIGFPPGTWPNEIMVRRLGQDRYFVRKTPLTDSAGYSYTSTNGVLVLDILND